MKKIRAFFSWLLMGLVLIDQAVNWLLGGSPDETLSSRAHRMRVKDGKGQKVWGWTADAIDFLWTFFSLGFGSETHCLDAYLSEVHRRQYPPEFLKPLEWPAVNKSVN